MTLSITTDEQNSNRVKFSDSSDDFAASFSFEKHYLSYVIDTLKLMKSEFDEENKAVMDTLKFMESEPEFPSVVPASISPVE